MHRDDGMEIRSIISRLLPSVARFMPQRQHICFVLLNFNLLLQYTFMLQVVWKVLGGREREI